MSIFGPIVGPGQVEAAAEQTLRAWLPSYLAELERQTGLEAGALPLPAGYQTVSDLDHLVEQALGGPILVLVSPGITDAPIAREAGITGARWTLNAVAIVPAESRARAHVLAGAYATAIRWTLVQQGSLGGLAAAVDWVDEEYLAIATDDRRVLGAGRVEVAVEVAVVLDRQAGPLPPPAADPAAPYPDWPTADPVEVDLTRMPVA